MDKPEIKQRLHEQRFRLTHEREVLVELFEQSLSMLTPKELYELALKQDLSVGLTTVYRLLEALTKIGVATPFVAHGNIYYTFCECTHHHHFVCLGCHRVFDVHDACPEFHLPDHFNVIEHRSDVFGTCSNCTKQEMGCEQ